MVKFTIVERDDPWVKWDKLVWKEYKDRIDYKYVQTLDEADIILWCTDVEMDFCDEDLKKVIPIISGGKANNLDLSRFKFCLTDNPETSRKNYNLETYIITKPIEDVSDIRIGSYGDNIVCICDAGHSESNIDMLIRSIMKIHVQGNEFREIAIFSHTDLPMEPFNNIKFMGFQPPALLDKYIEKNNSVIVHTSNIDRQPCTVIKYLGLVPTIAFRNSINIEYPFDAFFSDEEELMELLEDINSGLFGFNFDAKSLNDFNYEDNSLCFNRLEYYLDKFISDREY